MHRPAASIAAVASIRVAMGFANRLKSVAQTVAFAPVAATDGVSQEEEKTCTVASPTVAQSVVMAIARA
jgi:hypothetical protein